MLVFLTDTDFGSCVTAKVRGFEEEYAGIELLKYLGKFHHPCS